jgi:hypothetical protein
MFGTLLRPGFPQNCRRHPGRPGVATIQSPGALGAQIAIHPVPSRISMACQMKPYFWKAPLTLALCFLLSGATFVPPAHAQNVPSRIEIIVVAGEGATNKTREHASTDPSVRIEDDDHRPVSGAAVVFALPVSGASGEFTNGAKTLAVVTDQNGVATAHGLRISDVAGKLQIYVTASYRGLRARTLINQVVEAPPGAKLPPPEIRSSKSHGKWKWIVLAVAAAGGAGAGVYYANRNSSSSPVSVTAGTVVFGSPR